MQTLPPPLAVLPVRAPTLAYITFPSGSSTSCPCISGSPDRMRSMRASGCSTSEIRSPRAVPTSCLRNFSAAGLKRSRRLSSSTRITASGVTCKTAARTKAFFFCLLVEPGIRYGDPQLSDQNGEQVDFIIAPGTRGKCFPARAPLRIPLRCAARGAVIVSIGTITA